MPTCDYVSGRVGQPSKRCNRKAYVRSEREIFISDGPFVGRLPMTLHYCHKHEHRAGISDYKSVRVVAIVQL